MTLLKNSLEGGTDGTTITASNSGGTSGSAFSSTVHTSPAALVYDNAVSAHGTFSALVTVTSTQPAYVEFDFSDTTCAVRAYFYFDTLPSQLIRIIDIRNSSGTILRLQVQSTNKLQVQEGGTGTAVHNMALTLSAAHWYRAEMVLSNISATAGSYKFDYYDLDGTSPKETGVNVTTGNVGTTAIAKVVIGSTAFSTSTYNYHFDDPAVNNGSTTYIGAEDQAPVAVIGPDQSVNTGATVTLDGTGSFDPDSGDVISWLWTHVSGPNPSGLSSTTSSSPTYVATNPGVDQWALTITDNHGVSSTDAITNITISNPVLHFYIKRSGTMTLCPSFIRRSGAWESTST